MPSDALENLLVTKYGVPEKQARLYAAQIIAGHGDGHGDALKGEALSNVASREQMRMNEMSELADIVARRQAGEKLPPEYSAILDEKIADSADQTWQNAMKAGSVELGPVTANPVYEFPVGQPTPPVKIEPPASNMMELTGQMMDPTHPYQIRLRRMEAARRAMLGK